MTVLDRFRWWPALLGLTLGVVLGSAPVQGQLTAEPASVSVAVARGEAVTQMVTLSNVGAESLVFCITFDRPLQRVAGRTRLSVDAAGGEAPCGVYGAV